MYEQMFIYSSIFSVMTHFLPKILRGSLFVSADLSAESIDNQ
jgi:hypothetical protein